MGCLFSKSNTVPSVPTPEKPQSPQPTSIPDRTTSTQSPRPGTPTSARRPRAQTGLSQRHNGGRDYPPPSSGGDVLTAQHPDRQEMRSRQHPSGGTGHMQRTRSVSMDVAGLQGAPSQSAGRRNRTASTATGQITAGRQGGRPRFPSTLQSLLSNDFRYEVGRCPIMIIKEHFP
jgi:hypothetical protein